MKRIWLYLVIVLALILSACGGQAVEAPAAEEAAVEEAPAAEEAAVEETAAEDLYTVKMVYWPGPESDAMQKVVDYFNENRAEEAGFNVEQVLFGRDQVVTKQEALMAAQSDEVDLYFIASRWLGKYHTFLEPIDSYITDPEINIYDSGTDYFLDAAIDGLRWFDGDLYAAPRDISAHFLYYRQDYMDELLSNEEWQAKYREISKEQMGVEMEPKDPAEWTWDDYLAASYFFTKAYNADSPTEYGNFTHGKVMGPTSFLWTNAYWGYGGDWFDAEGNPTFDNEAAAMATELWKTFYEKGLTPESSVVGEYPECNEALKTGQVALAVHWNAAFYELDAEESPVSGKFAVVAPPAGPEGRFTYNHTLAVSLNKFSGHKEETGRWLAYLFTDEANQIYADAGGIPPAESILMGMGETRPDFVAMAEAVADSGANLPPTAGIIENMVCEALSNGWTGAMPIEDVLTQLQQDTVAEMANWE